MNPIRALLYVFLCLTMIPRPTWSHSHLNPLPRFVVQSLGKSWPQCQLLASRRATHGLLSPNIIDSLPGLGSFDHLSFPQTLNLKLLIDCLFTPSPRIRPIPPCNSIRTAGVGLDSMASLLTHPRCPKRHSRGSRPRTADSQQPRVEMPNAHGSFSCRGLQMIDFGVWWSLLPSPATQMAKS